MMLAILTVLLALASSPAFAGFDAAMAAAEKGDYATALMEFRPLAERGNAAAQNNLGIIYSKGLGGVEKNDVEAVWWFSRAAQQDNATAQHNLGVMYSEARGVKQHLSQAHMWLSLAEAQGIQEAGRARRQIEQSMSRAQLTGARRMAREWKLKHRK